MGLKCHAIKSILINFNKVLCVRAQASNWDIPGVLKKVNLNCKFLVNCSGERNEITI